MTRRHETRRRGAALVEAAIVLPVMLVLIGIGVDYSRVFYSSVTLSGSSRNAAIYEFDPFSYSESNYGSYTAAAQADATNLTNNVSFTRTATLAANGSTSVTINSTSNFKMLASWGILPTSKNVNRTVVIRQAQLMPD